MAGKADTLQPRPPGAADDEAVERLRQTLLGIGEALGRAQDEGIGGAQMHFALLALRQAVVGEIKCTESVTEAPSPMGASYANGEVVFRCDHSPPHEFRVKV